MTSDYSIVLSLLRLSGGTIEGRKRLQKEVCILKYEYSIPFTFEYIPYYYGPFSDSLASALDDLVGLGYILEERKEYGGLLQYTYSLTPSGNNFANTQLEYMKQVNLELFEKLSSGAQKMKSMSTPELVIRSKEVTKYMYTN